MFRKFHPYKYDVFLSHAFEDKEHIANELNDKLREAGIKVWYSGNDLRMGEDLDEVILRRVIPRSRYGVVVLSKDYFLADWGRTELNLLHSYESTRDYKIILPVWHEIDEHQIRVQFPHLIGRFAVKTEKGIDFIVREIVEKVREKSEKTPTPAPPGIMIRKAWRAMLISCISVLLIVLSSHYRNEMQAMLANDEIYTSYIENRIASVDAMAKAEYTNWQYTNNVSPGDFNKSRALRINFTGTNKHCSKNTHSFFTGFSKVSSRKGILDAGVNIGDALSGYGITDCSSCFDTSDLYLSYSVFNNKPVTYHIEEVNTHNNQTIVKVSYTDPLRCVITTLKRYPTGDGCQSESTLFFGLRSVEEFVFEQGPNGLIHTATQ